MKITVIGAYGYTGRLICEKLESNGISFSVVGRNLEKLIALKEEFKYIESFSEKDISNSNAISEIINSADIIVNCAGPFTEESTIFLEKISSSGKIYLDITGEIGYVRASNEKYNQLAIESGTLIIHGCAFESLIADLGLQILEKENGKLNQVKTFYWLNQKTISPGTKIKMKLSKYRDSYKISESEWKISDLVNDRYAVKWQDLSETFCAVPYPLPEIAYSFWNYKPLSAESFLLLNTDEARFVLPNVVPKISAQESLIKLRSLKQNGPSAEERTTQASIIVLNVVDRNDNVKTIFLENNDMYQTTAKAILISIQKLMSSSNHACGVVSPAKLFQNEEKETLDKLNTRLTIKKDFSLEKC